MKLMRRCGLLVAVVCACILATFTKAMAGAPHRIVSMNVCTDQLAMLIADEGQLYSVSHLASDPLSSVLAEEAHAFAVNHGQAEEIFLMKPDLVLAGTYTTRATVELLRRLGFRVEEFAPASSFDEIKSDIKRIGALLGREERAKELVAELNDGLAELAGLTPSGKIAASYSSNSYTTGAGTLADNVMKAAGVKNMGAEKGVIGGARLPLEMLIVSQPDMVVTGASSYDRPALAQENFVHPAFRAFSEGKIVKVPENYWICGAPFTLQAAHILRQAAENLK